MSRFVYYRWRKGQVIPRVTVLRRLCLQTGIDIQYVLTGIPFRDEKCQLSLRYYQEQSQHAKTLEDRLHAFYQIAAQSYAELVTEFPKCEALLSAQPFPSAKVVNKVDELLRFEIAIIPKDDHTVYFELYRFEPLYPVPVCSRDVRRGHAARCPTLHAGTNAQPPEEAQRGRRLQPDHRGGKPLPRQAQCTSPAQTPALAPRRGQEGLSDPEKVA